MKKLWEAYVVETSLGTPGLRRGIVIAAALALTLGAVGAAWSQENPAEAPAAESPAKGAPEKGGPANEAPAKAPKHAAKNAPGAESAAPESSEEADWPCEQKFVATMSAATIWSGPSLDEAMKSWHSNDKLPNLITQLTDDTIEEADGVKIINDFAASLSADKDKNLTELFAGLFENFDNERIFMQEGIKRYFHRQQAVATKVNKIQAKIRELQKSGVKPDAPQYVQVKTDLDWNNKIYDERKVLTQYVCEVPTLLEQRLGTYGRAIQAQMSGGK